NASCDKAIAITRSILKAQAIAQARPMLKAQVKDNNNACKAYLYQDMPKRIPSVQAKRDDNAEVNESLRPSKSNIEVLSNMDNTSTVAVVPTARRYKACAATKAVVVH
ncbi:hypothetical protein U1Q18_049722, partial [Sarracenia purpurea var. burkii]